MKKLVLLTSILFSCLSSHSQTEQYTDQEIKIKCDSILNEANTLYRYEIAAWKFTDMFMGQPEIAGSLANYLTYEQGDSIKCIAIDKQGKCSYEVSFIETSKPCLIRHTRRDLSDYENKLVGTRSKILKSITPDKYELSSYDGFSLNGVLIPSDNGYKFYAISGTQKANIIPLGNDYLFTADEEGNITAMKKFHSQLMPIEKKEGAATHIHSHLKQEPFISATDICTFKLYQNQVGITSFGVYSPALSVYFIYQLESNTIAYTKDIEEYFNKNR